MKKKVFDIIKKVVASVVFLAILFTGLAQLSYLFRYEEKDKSISILSHFYAEEKNTADIVMIGSSATYRYYIPALMYHETGMSSILFSYPAFPFEAIKDGIDEVNKTQKPKLYILELRRLFHILYTRDNGSLFKDTTIATNTSYLSGLINSMPVSLNRAQMINKTITTYTNDDELDWQFDYMRTHNNWKDLKLNDIIVYLNNHFLKRDEYKEQGKNVYKISRTSTHVEPMVKPDFSKYKAQVKLTEEDLKPLNELIDFIRKENLNVLFVSTPYPIPEIAYAYENLLQDYLKEQGMNYIDCNEYYDEIGLNFPTDFYDEKHTNLAGSIKFTKFISSYILDNFDLKPSELSEKMKKEWDNAYTLWYDEVAVPGLEKINNAK